MSRFSFVLSFVLCVLAVEAFPNARRSGPERAYVLYSRCVEAPENNACGIGYKIRNIGDKHFDDLMDSFNRTRRPYDDLFPEPEAACPHLIMKLLCQNGFPECLPEGRLDYGDREELYRQIEEECVILPGMQHIGRDLVGSFRLNSFFKTGIQRDSDFDFKCRHVPQDPEQKCPKPEYAMPSRSVEEYYERIQNISRDMEKDRDDVPEVCFKKAFDLLACQSYVFCSADGDSMLMKTSEEDCLGIGRCLKKHDATINEDVKQFLDEVCPKFPAPGRNEEVDLPPN